METFVEQPGSDRRYFSAVARSGCPSRRRHRARTDPGALLRGPELNPGIRLLFLTTERLFHTTSQT
jgi:hypothetical protein